jgi:hypothetical protein
VAAIFADLAAMLITALISALFFNLQVLSVSARTKNTVRATLRCNIHLSSACMIHTGRAESTLG